MNLEDYGLTESELLFYFALGFVLGLLVLRLSRDLLEAWVIESDTAERRRIREELERWWDAQAQLEREEPQTVGTLTGEASRLIIAPTPRHD